MRSRMHLSIRPRYAAGLHQGLAPEVGDHVRQPGKPVADELPLADDLRFGTAAPVAGKDDLDRADLVTVLDRCPLRKSSTSVVASSPTVCTLLRRSSAVAG
ncbi:hypothetical protein GCM10023195_00160 [Actinoallomurus liliacearum]|uniref:Uncharacterized protein n=1 Tax=Actinoallomurus liliacearum TaxID=1080073 RepID=A0ABP8T8C6_9ACTN